MKKETKIILCLMAIVFIISFFVYLKTLAPTVSFGDSGDYISAAYVLGICHPPGYPLYLICAKLFSWLPIGSDIAYRINLMSAVFAAFAVSLLYLLILRIQQWFNSEEISWRGNRSIAIPDWILHFVAVIGALSFAFSSSFWSQAVVAEVHTMLAVFSAGIILCVLAYIKFGEHRYLYTASFLWGLGFGVHQTPILFLPAILLLFGVKGKLKKVVELKTILSITALAFFGWAVHLYLPLVAVRYPARNWDNPQQWVDFVKLVTRADYNKFRWYRPLGLAWEQTGTAVFTLINNQFTIFFYWLGIIGLWRMIKRDWKVAGFLFLIALFIWIFFSAVTNFPMVHNLYIDLREAFFIPAYLLYAIWIAFGIRWIFTVINSWIKKERTIVYYVSIVCIGLLLPAIILITHYHEQNKSEYYLAEDLGKAILDTMTPNAIYFASDDPFIFPVQYLQIVEKQRPDVVVISRGELYKEWFFDQLTRDNPTSVKIPSFEPDKVYLYEIYLDAKMSEFAELNLNTHPVYYLSSPQPKLNQSLKIIRTGILYQVVTTLPADVAVIAREPYQPSPVKYQYRGTAKDGISDDDWTQFAVLQFCGYYIRQGDYFAVKRNFKLAIDEYFTALKIKPNSADAYYRLGVLYEYLGDKSHAVQAYENVLILNPDYSDTKKRLEKIKP